MATSRTGRPWSRIVKRVLHRDGGICHLCGQPGADSADHLVPYSLGGARYDLSNLAAAHHNVWPHCNRVRGNRSIVQARADIAEIIERAEPSTATASWSW